MLPIILEAAIRSIVLAVVIWLALKALRISNPHVLMAVWQIVLVVSLLMPFFVGRAVFALPSSTLPPVALPVAQMLSTEPVFLRSLPPLVVPHIKFAIIGWRTVASSIYLFVATVLALRLLVGAALTWQFGAQGSVRTRTVRAWTEAASRSESPDVR